MKSCYKLLLALLCLLFFCNASIAQKYKTVADPNSKDYLVIMTYNIRHGKGMDGKVDYKRIADEISFVNPDIVALQEVDNGTGRSGGINTAEYIAKLSGDREAIFGETFDYDGGKFGNAILYRKGANVKFQNIPLPSGEEPRALLVAEFDNYFFACTHLSLDSAGRMDACYKIDEIMHQISKGKFKVDGKKFFSGKDKKIFMAGDFNALPSSSHLFILRRSFEWLSKDVANTFPSDTPDRILDYIFLFKNKEGEKLIENLNKDKMEFVTWTQEENMASDHRPVVCVLSDSNITIHKVEQSTGK